MDQRQPRAMKYLPLVRYLTDLPAEQERVTLTLTEIEQLLGACLPDSAWTACFWSTKSPALTNWRRQGWTGQFDWVHRHVTFVRVPATQPPLDTQAIIAAYRSGVRTQQIGQQYGLPTETVHAILHDAGVRPQQARGGGPSAPRNRRAPLQEEALIAAYQAGATQVDVSRQFGVSAAVVQRVLRQTGVPIHAAGRRPKADHAAIIAAYRAGATVAALSRQWQISPAAVSQLLRHAGVPPRPRGTPPPSQSTVA